MAHILITGVAGFIGSHTAEYFLRQGFQVSGIDNFDAFYDRSYKEKNLLLLKQNPDFRFFEYDFVQPGLEKILSNVPDAIIHLGAKAGVLPSLQNPGEYIRVNIEGTLRMLEYMQKVGCKKLLFASSSSVYGNTPVPFSESADVTSPISPYAFSKKSGELLTYNFHHLYGFDVLNLRFFTVIGERQRPDLAVHKFVKAILNKETITLYGKGDTARDYTYVGDIVQGIFKAWKYLETHSGVYENINLGNNRPINLIEMVETIEEVLGVPAKKVFSEAKPGDMEKTFASIEKAGRLLGYQPETSFREGVRRFAEWFKAEFPS